MLLREYSFTADPLETVQFQLAIVVRVSESQSDFFLGGPSWSQTYEEGGQYSVWIHKETASNTSAICHHSVDECPRNVYLRE